MKRLVGLVVFAVVAVMVVFGFASAETKGPEEKISQVKEDQTHKGQGTYASASMKQDLLHPNGFDMIWSYGGRSGWSRVFFRDDGEKIVADIKVVDIENVDINQQEFYTSESCTGNAKLTDNGVIFDGCSNASRDILLAYDPGNKLTPFKGSGPDCPRIELSPR